MGILDWIEEKARKKMRFSQIKILYQNIFAVEFLLQTLADADSLKHCADIQERTHELALRMADVDMLEDALSGGLFDDNRTLKKLYADSAGEAVDFVERFAPVAGWKAFSEDDWDAVVRGISVG
ncbi:MAG: hypothetical protein GQ535_17030 [Rhodobacteraceae bacterium]|nr:hypothetical protein [Paracoccaceae bacterium]